MRLLVKLKALSRENWLLFLMTLINRTGSMGLIFLILFLHKHLGISVRIAGMIFSLYGIGALLAGPLGGLMADRFGAFWVMFFSFAFSGSTLLLYPLVHSSFGIAIFTFIWGLAGESYRPANQVIIQKFCLPEQRKIAIALNRMGINLGMSISPIIGGFLAHFYFNGIFIINGLMTLAAGIFLAGVFHQYFEIKMFNKKSQDSVFSSLKPAFLDSKMCWPMIAFILSMIIFFQQTTTLSLFIVHNIHVSITVFGLICSINALLIIFCELPLNVYISHWPNKSVLSMGAIFIGLGFGLYAIVTNVTGIIAGLFFWTLGEMILLPGLAAYIVEIAPSEKRGVYMGMYSMGINTALIVGPFVGTQITEIWGFTTLWLGCFMAGVISALIFYGTIKSPQKNEISLSLNN